MESPQRSARQNPISTGELIKGPVMPATQRAHRATGVAGITGAPHRPETEVLEMKPRRKFTAQYKLRILKEAETCTESGQLGALLRREGLYFSNLTTWRKQQTEGLLAAMKPRKRGRKSMEKNPLSPKLAELEKENERLRRRLKEAHTIIEVQKKVCEMLEISPGARESNDKD